MSEPETIRETIDLLDRLKELHGASYQEDPLKAAILFRTLLYIDSLHDFTNYLRFKSNNPPKKEDEDEEETDDEDEGEGISKKQSKKGQPEMTVANAKIYAGEMLKLLTNEYKNDCFNLIDKSTHEELKKVIQLFNSSKNIEFVYPDVGGNSSPKTILENGPTKVNNSANLELIKGKTALHTCGKYKLYNKNDTTLLFQYTGPEEKGVGKMKRYNNKLFEEIKKNHKSNNKNNVYFIILIAKLLYEINVHIQLGKFRISQKYLHTISDIITDFFGFMPINYIKKTDDVKSNITTLGFIHGLLCIKHNKYKNLDQHNSCTFTGDTAYLPNLIFTVDAEGSSKSTNYITELVKMFTNSEDIPKDKIKNVHLIKTKATKFDGATDSNFQKIPSIVQNIPIIDRKPQDYDLEIIFKCGEIELMHIKYEGNTKLTISKWFNRDVSGKSKTVSGVFTLNMAVNDFIGGDMKDVFNLHFKTVCDLGQILAFIAFQRYLGKKDSTIESKFLFCLHTLDKFCGQIGSLLHPGIVIEKQTMRDFTKEFPNTIYISTSEIKDEDGKRISDYDIKWHTLHPGETYTSQDIQKAKNEMDKLLEDSKKELNEKIENLKSELEEKTKLAEEQTKRAEQNSREKRKLTRKLEFSKIGTFNEQIKTAKAFAQSKAHEIKLQKELQKKDESLERHHQEELERILDRESLDRHREKKIKRKEKRETKRKKRKEEKKERKRREKSKKKREEKRREEKRRKRIRSSTSSSISPAQSRSPTSSSNSNTRKRRKVQSSIPPTSNSKKRQRSLSSSSPNAKRTRRSNPGASPSSSASGKKTRKKNKK
tara:strand:+ start:5872 stop:8340 length:2469 start_codon:yes stop_codon:yes gene_type:complete